MHSVAGSVHADDEDGATQETEPTASRIVVRDSEDDVWNDDDDDGERLLLHTDEFIRTNTRVEWCQGGVRYAEQDANRSCLWEDLCEGGVRRDAFRRVVWKNDGKRTSV